MLENTGFNNILINTYKQEIYPIFMLTYSVYISRNYNNYRWK